MGNDISESRHIIRFVPLLCVLYHDAWIPLTSLYLPILIFPETVGELLQQCHVSLQDQERILQGYMMNHMLQQNGVNQAEEDEDEPGKVPNVPDEALSRLPSHIRQEVILHVRSEAIKRRDAAFAHSSPGTFRRKAMSTLFAIAFLF
jgi:hypothetical protein